MCGIVGVHDPIGFAPSAPVEAMNAAQYHRGPDDGGIHVDASAGLALGMRRLAIVDIAGGRQPMSSEDGRYVLVYSGEIYNSPELRAELEAAGESFVTDHSDTEVLLRLLMREGECALPKLNGMFAFAFYDSAAGTVLLGRDRMGIKPLYYSDAAGRFAFASELKSLLALPWASRTIDRQSLFHFLTLQFVSGETSIFAGIRRLAPAHALIYRLADRSITIRRWWRPCPQPDKSVTANEWPVRIRETLGAAVRRWSLSDVPVACSLSGGLDSSAIVALLAQAGGKVRTVSLGFEGKDEENWSELPLARRVAEMWATEHTEVVLRPETLLDELAKMVWSLDEPYGGGLPSWLVFQQMSRQVKVGFTGTGGDEMFGNYGKWMGFEVPWLSHICGRGKAADVSEDLFAREFADRFYYFPDADKRSILTDKGEGLEPTSAMLFRHFAKVSSDSPRDRVAVVDLDTQLPEEFLLMTDRFAMAHSLEARTPFLDNEMVDLCLSIPARTRTKPRDLKGLLRRSVAPLLPKDLLVAPKKGFVIPLGPWLRNHLRPMVEDLLAPASLKKQGLFTPMLYERWVRPHLDGESDDTRRVWGMVMFQLWYRRFIEGETLSPADLRPGVTA